MASSWAVRSAQPAVVCAIGFDSDADLGTHNDPNTVRSLQDPSTSIYLKVDEDYTSPVLDTAVKTPSGAASLRFTHAPFTREGMQGTFYFNFSNDGSRRFGANETFYIQWRQRFDQNWINALLINNDGESYEPVTISGISKANPATVTYTGDVHPASGSYVLLRCKSGMTALHNKMCRAVNVNTAAGTFQLQNLNGTGVDTTGYPNFGTASFHTTAYQQVTSITRTSPAVVTYVGGDPDPTLYSLGYLFASFFVEGMTQLRHVVARIRNLNTTAKTFELEGVNATAFSPFTAGAVRIGTLQGGIKQLDTTAGDLLTWNGSKWVSTLSSSYGTSSENKIVTQTSGQFRFTKLYHYNLDGANADMYDDQGFDFYYHDHLTPKGSWSSLQQPNLPPNSGTNFPWVADEWMTFQLMVKLGPEGTATSVTGSNVTGPVWLNSEVELWCAREGQPQTLCHWYRPGIGGYEHQNRKPTPGVTNDPTGPKYGKVNIFPFCTAKGVAQDHPVMTTWVDEVIVSTGFIDDPLDAVVARVPLNDRMRAHGRVGGIVTSVFGNFQRKEPNDVFFATDDVYPQWRTGLPVGQWSQVQDTRMDLYYAPNPPYYDIGAILHGWNSLELLGNELWSVGGGGHGDYCNAAIKIDLMADQPVWVVVDQGSMWDVNDPGVIVKENEPYYGDGRGAGRHHYYMQHAVPAGVCADGKARIMFATSYATYTGQSPGGVYMPYVWGFRCADGVWDPPGTWADMELGANEAYRLSAQCQHPTDHRIFMAHGGQEGDPTYSRNISSFNPATNQWTRHSIVPTFAGPEGGSPTYRYVNDWIGSPALFDSLRNSIVCLAPIPGVPLDPLPPLSDCRISYVNVSTAGNDADPWVCTILPLVGAPTDLTGGVHYGGGFVHDLDNDRYLLLINHYQFGSSGESIETVMYEIIPAGKPNGGAITELTRYVAMAGTDAPLRKFNYAPQLGGVVFFNKYQQDMHFYPTRA